MTHNKILKLDSGTIGKIAAGEVVEKPAMVVKELVENAIDAEATEIIVDIRKGGKSQIRVVDNGSGIDPSDVPLVFERHATSKIRSINDLYETLTLGFRGEALASIAAVSNVELITMRETDKFGLKVETSAGKILKQSEVGAVRGTSITVKDLFFNTPARLKFLKSDQAETRAITELMSILAVSHPEIAIKYLVDDQLQFNTPGKGALDQTIFSVFESGIMKHLVKVEGVNGPVSLYGYISKFDYTKGTRSHQLMFVNGRFIKSDLLKDVVQMAYRPYLMNNRHAVCFLFLEIPPTSIDVNIHPAKTEIKFHDEGIVKQLVYTCLKQAFNLYNQVPDVTFTEKETFVKREILVQAPEVPKVKPENPKTFTPQIKPAYSPGPAPKVDFEVFEEMNVFANEVVEEMPQKKEASAYEGLDFVGRYNKTYLLFEKDETLVMVDQHAAHEKILYESFMKAYRRHEIQSQILLIPETVDLSAAAIQKLTESGEVLKRMGFGYDLFGERSIVVREIPGVFNLESAKILFMEVAEGIHDGLDRHFEEKLASKACKAAIKANDEISDLEVDALLNQLKNLDDPYTCPHGRPITISISKHEIERKFKRIL